MIPSGSTVCRCDQVCNAERLARQVQREFEMTPAQAELQLGLAVKDGLIEAYSATAATKGSPGQPLDVFRIKPDEGGDKVR